MIIYTYNSKWNRGAELHRLPLATQLLLGAVWTIWITSASPNIGASRPALFTGTSPAYFFMLDLDTEGIFDSEEFSSTQGISKEMNTERRQYQSTHRYTLRLP